MRVPRFALARRALPTNHFPIRLLSAFLKGQSHEGLDHSPDCHPAGYSTCGVGYLAHASARLTLDPLEAVCGNIILDGTKRNSTAMKSLKA